MLAAAIVLPLLALILFWGFRNFLRSLRAVKEAVEDQRGGRTAAELARRRKAEESAGSPARARPPVPPAPPQAAATGAAATFLAEAKSEDDAHKQRIRAHVQREMSAPDAGSRATIARAMGARLMIKQVFPPRPPFRSMSYFGELPIVPPDFDWPTLHNLKGELERPNFLAQIDCADIPPGPGRDLLPKAGILYFFAPLSFTFGEDACHFVTRYLAGKPTQRWEPLDMPFTGKIEPDDPLDLVWRGRRTHFDKAEIAFAWIAEPSDGDVAARAGEGLPHDIADRIRQERLDAVFGPRGQEDTLFLASNAPADSLWIPYPGFPANWKTARILRSFVEAYRLEETRDVAQRLEALGDVAHDDPELQRLHDLQRDLAVTGSRVDNAFFPTLNARIDPCAAPPEEVKAGILALLEYLRVNAMPQSKHRRMAHQALPAVLTAGSGSPPFRARKRAWPTMPGRG